MISKKLALFVNLLTIYKTNFQMIAESCLSFFTRKSSLMKKSKHLIYLIMVIFFVSACRDKRSTVTTYPDQDTSSTPAAQVILTDTAKSDRSHIVHTEAEKRDEIHYADSVDFKKYAAEISLGSKAEIDWSSNPEAKTFKTRIINGYEDQEVDFAGHYIGVAFGCGGGCVLGFMIDTRDGKIYNLPLGEENMCVDMQDAALHRGDSKLFISAVCKERPGNMQAYYKAYLWDEQNKQFDRLNEKDFLKRD